MSGSEPREVVHSGGCQCGAIRYAFYDEPIRVGICHCRMCQRATGGPFAVLADVAHESFAWTRGTPSSYRSSNIAERDFCSACGTPLSYRQIGGANVELLIGTFDRAKRLAPTYAVAVESKLDWVDTIHSIPGKTLTAYLGEDAVHRITPLQDLTRDGT